MSVIVRVFLSWGQHCNMDPWYSLTGLCRIHLTIWQNGGEKKNHQGTILKQPLGLGQVLIVDLAHVRSVEVDEVSYPPPTHTVYAKRFGCPEKCSINSSRYCYCYIKPGQKLAKELQWQDGVSVTRAGRGHLTSRGPSLLVATRCLFNIHFTVGSPGLL